MKPLVEYFPKNDTPREPQIKALEYIEECIKDGVKFIILECPTGTGKSHIASTICNYSDDCSSEFRDLVDSNEIFGKTEDGSWSHEDEIMDMEPWGASCLTVTKNLQNQYENLFSNVVTLKGKSNYDCNLDNTFTVDVAPCTTSWKLARKCIQHDTCEFYSATKRALTSKFSVYNYSKFLTLPKFARKRQFLICDEASEIEDIIVSFFTLDISYKTLDTYGVDYGGVKLTSDKNRDIMKWLSVLDASLKSQIGKLKKSLQSTAYSASEKKRNVKRLKYFKETSNSVALVQASNKICEYVCQYNNEQFTLSPLYIDTLANVLWANNTHVIMMSGTIFDHHTFTRTLGIKKSEYRFFETDCEFDPESSPIYIPARYALNHKTQDTVLPRVIEQAREIVDGYKDENGLIHTHTNKITGKLKSVVEKTDRDRYIFREGKATNEHIILQHAINDEPTVVVSPSMAFGVDLPDDLSRFQIVMKLPYLSLGDKRVSELFKRDKDWYAMKMFVKLIQMCGRSTRSKDDYSSTYILDLAAVSAIKRGWSKLPEHFKQRLK